jgi:hypothetical protein
MGVAVRMAVLEHWPATCQTRDIMLTDRRPIMHQRPRHRLRDFDGPGDVQSPRA